VVVGCVRCGGVIPGSNDANGGSRTTPLAFCERTHAEYAAARLTQILEDVRAAGAGGTPYRGAMAAEAGSAEQAVDTDETDDVRRRRG
jgi:hypothetical protein